LLRVSLTIFAGLLLAGLVVLGFGWQQLQRPHLEGDSVVVDIPRGASFRSLTAQLQAAGVIDHSLPFLIWGRVSGLAADVKAGEYEFTADTTPVQALQQIVDGRVKLYSLTILEGWTVSRVLAALAERSELRHTLEGMNAETLLSALGVDDGHAEGWFFPDTYVFPRGTSDAEILRRAYRRMEQELAQAWAQRDVGLTLAKPYEALILASVIEKETGRADERHKVSQVFHRRLAIGMRLQTDPTVIYGYGDDFDGRLTRRLLHTDHPYNTYTRTGLPPTPIALPGRAALLAAVQPTDTEYLFFVARGDGSSFFSHDYETHRAAVRRYQLGLED
jgi:UPF0755 protein